jgi:signal transduction histidine kinase
MLLEGQLVLALVLVPVFIVGLVIGYVSAVRVYKRRSQERLKKSKDQFVSLASHYLLTPISIIQGALSRLQEADSALSVEDRLKLYETINKGQQRLWILAEELILANQIEGNMLVLKRETNNIADVVEDSVAAVDIFAREKQIRLVIDNQTIAIQQARFDYRRVKQAVIAILDNAIKFSPEGSAVRSTIRLDGQYVFITIEDQGMGMSRAIIDSLATSFTRGTSSYTYDHEGIGLGVYIANAIAREHDGVLQYTSQPTKGTVAVFQFPIT